MRREYARIDERVNKRREELENAYGRMNVTVRWEGGYKRTLWGYAAWTWRFPLPTLPTWQTEHRPTCRRRFHEATRRVLGAPSEWYLSTCIGLRCVEDWRIRDSRSGTWNWVGGEECVVLLIGGGGGDVWIAVVKMGEDYGVSFILVWEVSNV